MIGDERVRRLPGAGSRSPRGRRSPGAGLRSPHGRRSPARDREYRARVRAMSASSGRRGGGLGMKACVRDFGG